MPTGPLSHSQSRFLPSSRGWPPQPCSRRSPSHPPAGPSCRYPSGASAAAVLLVGDRDVDRGDQAVGRRRLGIVEVVDAATHSQTATARSRGPQSPARRLPHALKARHVVVEQLPASDPAQTQHRRLRAPCTVHMGVDKQHVIEAIDRVVQRRAVRSGLDSGSLERRAHVGHREVNTRRQTVADALVFTTRATASQDGSPTAAAHRHLPRPCDAEASRDPLGHPEGTGPSRPGRRSAAAPTPSGHTNSSQARAARRIDPKQLRFSGRLPTSPVDQLRPQHELIDADQLRGLSPIRRMWQPVLRDPALSGLGIDAYVPSQIVQPKPCVMKRPPQSLVWHAGNVAGTGDVCKRPSTAR